MLELAGWFQPATTVQTQVRLLLDVGSGTGLSSAAARSLIAQHGSGSQVAVVGCDASLGMLAERRGKDRDEGACAADIGSGRLPFRGSCFDGAFSVSAIHYLCHDLPKLGITGRQRAEHLFREVLRVLSSDSSNSVGRVVFCAQFFPEEPAHARLLLEAALAAGWGEHRSALVVDQTHHTEGQRWYIVCRRGCQQDAQSAERQRSTEHCGCRCCCQMYSAGLGVQACRCNVPSSNAAQGQEATNLYSTWNGCATRISSTPAG